MATQPRPILLDTDIGTDIDDVYALILAATCPEFDLRAVTTVNNGVELRARLARRALDLLGRSDVPVAIGQGESLTPKESRGWGGHEGKGITLPETFAGTIYAEKDAAACIAEEVNRAYDEGDPLTLLPIGAMTNIALAFQRYPEIKSKIAEIISMAADYRGFGAENGRVEHNIACDSVAADIVLRSGVPITLIGLNVTQQTTMTQADVDAVKALGGDLAEFLGGMHEVWFEFIKRDHSAMHDGLTLALLLDPAILTLKPMYAEVIPSGEKVGQTVYFSASDRKPNAQVATAVDAERYHRLLQQKVLAEVRKAAGAS